MTLTQSSAFGGKVWAKDRNFELKSEGEPSTNIKAASENSIVHWLRKMRMSRDRASRLPNGKSYTSQEKRIKIRVVRISDKFEVMKNLWVCKFNKLTIEYSN